MCRSSVDGRVHRFAVAHVGDPDGRRIADFGGHGEHFVGFEADEGHLAALGGEFLGDACADATCGTGHDGHRAGEFLAHDV